MVTLSTICLLPVTLLFWTEVLTNLLSLQGRKLSTETLVLMTVKPGEDLQSDYLWGWDPDSPAWSNSFSMRCVRTPAFRLYGLRAMPGKHIKLFFFSWRVKCPEDYHVHTCSPSIRHPVIFTSSVDIQDRVPKSKLGMKTLLSPHAGWQEDETSACTHTGSSYNHPINVLSVLRSFSFSHNKNQAQSYVGPMRTWLCVSRWDPCVAWL